MKTKVGSGCFAGLLAAFICGIVMSCIFVNTADGTISMIQFTGKLTGNANSFAGWLNTEAAGCILGGIFGVVFGSRVLSFKGGLSYGLVYGLYLWVLCGLMLTPLLLGMSVFAFFLVSEMEPVTWWALLDYVVYSTVLGVCFFAVYKPGVVQSVKNLGERVGIPH